MPRPRFDNLSDEKRQRILEAAAREFSTYGYENASMNNILEQASISKGAAYYYFDDKADLFATTLEYYADYVGNSLVIDETLAALSKDNFWRMVNRIYIQHVEWTYEHPHLSGLIHAAWNLSDESLEHEQLRQRFEALKQVAEEIILMGQKLGTIRSDLPNSLLMSLVFNLDSASDRWLRDNLGEYTKDELVAIAQKVAGMIEKMLTPDTGH